MLDHSLRPASASDLRWLWPAVRQAHLFMTSVELERHWREAPWRIQVSDRHEAALLARWRDHLDVLAVRGLWCGDRHVPSMLHGLRSIAHAHGFGALLSPLVPEEVRQPYERAGMRVVERILVLRHDAPLTADVVVPEGVRLRIGSADDLAAVSRVDERSFSDFWRYDERTLRRYIATERLGIAEADEGVIGYTLCTAAGQEGTIGRLAVDPEWRRRGVAGALLRDALGYMERRGARSATLSTQSDNAASRRLYAKTGFRELSGRLVFLMTEDLGSG